METIKVYVNHAGDTTYKHIATMYTNNIKTKTVNVQVYPMPNKDAQRHSTNIDQGKMEEFAKQIFCYMLNEFTQAFMPVTFLL